MLDVLVVGGTVVDGLGSSRRRADVGVAGDRIVAVGDLADVPARRVVRADGLLVTPGFVDPHSHTDWTVHTNRDAESTIRQGVTTEVVGNCGLTNAPFTAHSAEDVTARLRAFGYEDAPTWRTFGDYLDDVAAGGTSQNLAWLVGHSTLRAAAGVSGSRVTAEQHRTMVESLREALDAGALGMSTGLEYGLGRFAGADELDQLARVVAEHGGVYASHLRNRDAGLLPAIDEFVRIAHAAGGRGQVSHLGVRHSTGAAADAWQRSVERLEAENSAGLDLAADITPLTHGIGLMVAVLPDWLIADGTAQAARQLADPVVRDRLRRDCDRYWRFLHAGQWDRATLDFSGEFPDLRGLTFTEVATRLGRDDPWDAYFDILQAAGPGMGSLVMLGELYTDDHLAETARHPLFSLGVDCYSSSATGPLAQLVRNPLAYCGTVHYLTHHVRSGVLTLEDAIHKLTAKPARRFGLTGRGTVEEGAYADLVVLDLDQLAEVSTYVDPVRYVRGVDTVLVNGRVVVHGGNHTGDRPGRVLR